MAVSVFEDVETGSKPLSSVHTLSVEAASEATVKDLLLHLI